MTKEKSQAYTTLFFCLIGGKNMEDLYCIFCGYELSKTADGSYYCKTCDNAYTVVEETEKITKVEIQK